MSEAAVTPAAARALRIVLRYRLMALRHRLSRLVVRGPLAPSVGGPRRGQVKPQGSAGVVLLGAGFLLISIVFCQIRRARPAALRRRRRRRAAHLHVVRVRLARPRGGRGIGGGRGARRAGGPGLGMRDPRRMAGRVEELLALPTTPAVAVAAEVAERALGHLLWLTVWPLLTAALFAWGWGRSALLVAVPLTALHAVTLAAVEFTAAALLQRVPPALAATLRSAALGLAVS
jgi:hypothetical protein